MHRRRRGAVAYSGSSRGDFSSKCRQQQVGVRIRGPFGPLILFPWLLRKPTLLVFDEATSSLDSITEEEITKTVQDVTSTKEHITVLVAHRLSTIMHADKIYVLEKGVVSESGTHKELVDQKGLYYAMWRQQIGER